jgi:predicted transcriptional regulator
VAVKVFDSELKVMEALWKDGDLTAGRLAKIMSDQTGWNRNTTYTVIGKLVDKGAVQRMGSDFLCRPLITKEQVQLHEVTELIDRLFDGSEEVFLSAFLSGKALSQEKRERLKEIVEGRDEKKRLEQIVKKLK